MTDDRQRVLLFLTMSCSTIHLHVTQTTLVGPQSYRHHNICYLFTKHVIIVLLFKHSIGFLDVS